MIDTLWITGFFLLSSSIAILSFVAFATLYVEAYLRQARASSLVIMGGCVFVIFGFITNIVGSFTSFSDSIVTNTIALSFHAVGFTLLAWGLFLDKIPGKPKVKTGGEKIPTQIPVTIEVENPVPVRVQAVVFPGFIALFAIGASIIYLWRKVTYGMSREFRELLIAFIMFFIYFTIESITVGMPQLILIFVQNPSDIYLVSLANYILLFAAGYMLLVWIYRFIAFQTVIRVFFSIWQLFITLSVLFAIAISAATIYFTQGQIYDILSKNSQLITFNLSEIRKTNIDLLQIFAKDKTIIDGIVTKDNVKIETFVTPLLQNNKNIDGLIFTDDSALVVYDTNSSKSLGLSISNNTVVKKAILDIAPQSGYVRQQVPGGGYELTYQQAVPVFNTKEELVGVLLAKKFLNDNYLDILHEQTGQALILYVNGFRSASTVVDNDTVSRFQNLPLESGFTTTYSENNPFVAVPILTKKYYMSVVPLQEHESNSPNYLLVGTEQQALVSAAENIIYASSAAVIFFCVLSIIPLYLFAKRMDKDVSS